MPLTERKYYYIDPRQHQNRDQYSDEEWKTFAEENGENYCLTEEEYDIFKNDEYLEYMEYRYI